MFLVLMAAWLVTEFAAAQIPPLLAITPWRQSTAPAEPAHHLAMRAAALAAIPAAVVLTAHFAFHTHWLITTAVEAALLAVLALY